MTSKQRLMNVLCAKPVDRVPISTYELCARNARAFENSQPSYAKLMAFIREHTDAVTMWDMRSNGAYVNSAYTPNADVERFDEGDYHVTRTTVNTPNRALTRTAKRSDNVMTVWNTEHLCKDTDDVDALMNLPYEPVFYDATDYPRIAAEVGDHGIIMSSLADPACIAMEIMEFGEATIWALTQPEHFKATLDELHRRAMKNLDQMLKTQAVDLYRICGPEYITPPYLSPKHFEMFVYPYLCDMVALIHRYGKKARIHSHGKIGQVLDMIIDTGADAIDPCEAPPDGDILLADISRRIDGKMCIFGNLQLKLLEHATAIDVENEVKLCLKAAKDSGRYVIMPTAAPINIPLSTKTQDNYITFIKTALEYGTY